MILTHLPQMQHPWRQGEWLRGELSREKQPLEKLRWRWKTLSRVVKTEGEDGSDIFSRVKEGFCFKQ